MATKTITTPAGIARYPSLNRADTKFDDIGVFKVNLEMSSDDAAPFIEAIDGLFSEFLADKKRELKKEKLKLHAFPVGRKRRHDPAQAQGQSHRQDQGRRRV
jgi:hypothetical protein